MPYKIKLSFVPTKDTSDEFLTRSIAHELAEDPNLDPELRTTIAAIDEDFNMGFITRNERANQIVDAGTHFYNGITW